MADQARLTPEGGATDAKGGPDAAAGTAAAVAAATADSVSGSLVLVRHGESTWIAEGRFQGRADPPLSPLGERQAARVAARLADPGAPPALPLPAGGPVGVWHSPLRRAAVVARGVAEAHGVGPVALDDLAELDYGAWEGLSRHEVATRYGQELAAWRRDPARHHAPGGESLAAAGERAARVRDVLLEGLASAPVQRRAGAPRDTSSDGGAVAASDPSPWLVAVAHDGLLRLLLLALLGLPPDRLWSFPFALCALTVVEVRDGAARLRAHNLADHLDGLTNPVSG